MLATASLPAGRDEITALYNGDGNYAGAASAPVTLTVDPLTLTTVHIFDVSPDPLVASKVAQGLDLTGVNFRRGDMLRFTNMLDGSTRALAAHVLNGGELTANVNFAATGEWSVQVVGPDKQGSNERRFNLVGAAQSTPPPATGAGWYYPVPTLQPTTAWLAGAPDHPAYLAGKVHLGTDLHAPKGTPVYAIGSGTVIGVQGPAQDWGPANHAVAILQTTSTGIQFIAIYGHIHTGFRLGDYVLGGEQIGTTGALPPGSDGAGGAHLHFGINQGSAYPTASTKLGKGWGRESVALFKMGDYNGFVDPLDWINSVAAPT